MSRGVAVFVVLLAILSLLPAVSAQGCTVLTAKGFQDDLDCDNTPDALDNCPEVPNSQQYDMNRNGVGDACDILIEGVETAPDNHLYQGEFAHLTVRLINNRQSPLENVDISAKNEDLDVDEGQVLPYLPAGEMATLDFWLFIPKCAESGAYDIEFRTEFFDVLQGKTVEESLAEPLYVDDGDACGTPDGPLDTTILTIFEKVDIERGDSALLPLTIANHGEDEATYDLVLNDLGTWGSWRVDPAATVVLPGGEETTIYTHIDTSEDTPAGTRDLELTVTAKDQQTVVRVSVYVRGTLTGSESPGFWIIFLQVLIVIVLIFLILAAVIVAISHMAKDKPKDKPAVAPAAKKKRKRKTAKKRARKKVGVEKAPKRKRKTYY